MTIHTSTEIKWQECKDTLQGYYASAKNHFYEKTASARSGINETINHIAKFNFKYIILSVAFAFFSHNIVLISGVLGGIFYEFVNEKIGKTVDAVYEAYFRIVNPIIDAFKIQDYRVLAPVIHGGVCVAIGLGYILLFPVSHILTVIYFSARCGADIAANCVKIAQELGEKSGDLGIAPA